MGNKSYKPGGGLVYLGGGLWGMLCGGHSQPVPIGYQASDGRFLQDCKRPYEVDPANDKRPKMSPAEWYALQKKEGERPEPEPERPSDWGEAVDNMTDREVALLNEALRRERARQALRERRVDDTAEPVQLGFGWAQNLAAE